MAKFWIILFLLISFPMASLAQSGIQDIDVENISDGTISSKKTKKLTKEEIKKIRENFVKNNTLEKEDRYQPPQHDKPQSKVSPHSKILKKLLKSHTGPPAKVEIIMDSSGSMGQHLGKTRTKAYYAKKLLSRYLIDQWKQKAYVGMRVYGSKKRNDCTDNYLAVPFKKKSIGRIERQVTAMMPVGRTPIHQSLEKAFRDLKRHKGPKKVVLFTDGKETCGGDPCQLKKDSKIDVEIYVVAIGFDPKSKDLDNVDCLGKTTVVNSESELFEALGDISNDIYRGNNLVVKSPDPSAAVNLYQIVKGKPKYFRTFTAAWGIKVPPGTYEAEVLLKPYFRFPRFKIPPGQKITLVVNGTGEVVVKFMDQLLTVDLLDKHLRVVHRFKSDLPFLAKTGRYRLRVYQDPFFTKLIDNFYVFPGGKHTYIEGAAGVIQFDHPTTKGFYIYEMSNKLVGTYLTNLPVVLKSATYRVFLNDKCFIRALAVGSLDKEIKHISCDDVERYKETFK